ncbi:MAG: cellulase family glycosylhydrolase, partial [Thermoguttaceae bacterium]|nr:cellulase family glycosylhydrolase [Thermoguttaceae bacterium]
MFKLKSLLFLVALAFLTSFCAADENAPLFPFNATGEQIARIWNSPTLAKPAGADGLIRVENEHFVNDAGIVRFWGVNVCMGACFPEKETATAMAERLASFGLNIVRLHHMDMREIWGKNYPKQLEFDPEKLDRLDWFISELKRCGIYVNINLHVSRKFTEADGFPEEDLRPNHDKGLDHFMPRMIELQKKYARDLLRHVNPYTGKCYADEPCVAVVEINNENSIVSQWRGWALNRNLPKYCEEELQKQWNAWLRT